MKISDVIIKSGRELGGEFKGSPYYDRLNPRSLNQWCVIFPNGYGLSVIEVPYGHTLARSNFLENRAGDEFIYCAIPVIGDGFNDIPVSIPDIGLTDELENLMPDEIYDRLKKISELPDEERKEEAPEENQMTIEEVLEKTRKELGGVSIAIHDRPAPGSYRHWYVKFLNNYRLSIIETNYRNRFNRMDEPDGNLYEVLGFNDEDDCSYLPEIGLPDEMGYLTPEEVYGYLEKMSRLKEKDK